MNDPSNQAADDQYNAASADQRGRMSAAGQDLGYEVDQGRVSPQIRQLISDATTDRGRLCSHIVGSSSPQPIYMDLAEPDMWVCARCIPFLPQPRDDASCAGCGTRDEIGDLAIRSGPLMVLTIACPSCRGT